MQYFDKCFFNCSTVFSFRLSYIYDLCSENTMRHLFNFCHSKAVCLVGEPMGKWAKYSMRSVVVTNGKRRRSLRDDS